VASVLGRERAYRISPARSAQRRGMRFSLHNDAPVVPPNILFLIWSAVTRQSRSGEVIGTEQRLSPVEALRAVTDRRRLPALRGGDQGLDRGRQAGRHGCAVGLTRCASAHGGDQGHRGAANAEGGGR
jgi:predicted amidohydrolase YtcJ